MQRPSRINSYRFIVLCKVWPKNNKGKVTQFEQSSLISNTPTLCGLICSSPEMNFPQSHKFPLKQDPTQNLPKMVVLLVLVWVVGMLRQTMSPIHCNKYQSVFCSKEVAQIGSHWIPLNALPPPRFSFIHAPPESFCGPESLQLLQDWLRLLLMQAPYHRCTMCTLCLWSRVCKAIVVLLRWQCM